MNKQQLNERITTIKQEMEVMKANYSKLEGNLNESEHWLQTLIAFEEDQIQPEIDPLVTMDCLSHDKEQKNG